MRDLNIIEQIMVLAGLMGLAGGFAACALWAVVDELLKKKRS